MSIECPAIDGTFRVMLQKLSRVMPDFEIQRKAELVFAINRLKKERGAIILSWKNVGLHRYQLGADQRIDQRARQIPQQQTRKVNPQRNMMRPGYQVRE